MFQGELSRATEARISRILDTDTENHGIIEIYKHRADYRILHTARFLKSRSILVLSIDEPGTNSSKYNFIFPYTNLNISASIPTASRHLID